MRAASSAAAVSATVSIMLWRAAAAYFASRPIGLAEPPPLPIRREVTARSECEFAPPRPPSSPRPPPPPRPPRCASLTLRLLPSRSCPSIASIAARMVVSVANDTNAKLRPGPGQSPGSQAAQHVGGGRQIDRTYPRERVGSSRSMITRTSNSSPKRPKAAASAGSVVVHARPPTNNR